MRIALSFIFLFLPWICLSGLLDSFHLTLGVLSSAIIAIWSGEYFIPDLRKSLTQRAHELARFCYYCLWLFKEIIMANVQVISVALSPNMMDKLDPKMVTFKTKLKHELPQFVLANSITLTPGTVTVRIKDDEFLVHALTNEVAQSLDDSMEKKIQKIFGNWA